jgi:hypothetical protein
MHVRLLSRILQYRQYSTVDLKKKKSPRVTTCLEVLDRMMFHLVRQD